MLRKRQVPQRNFDQMRRSTCANCPCGCGVKVFLKSGSIVDIFGDEDHPANKGSFCPKGLLAYRHQANPDRLVHPLVRADRTRPFERATWTEAIDFAAKRLGELAGRMGREACYVHCTPSSPFGHLLGGTLFAREFGTPHGPFRFLARAFGRSGALAAMFGIAGAHMLMNPPRDWCYSRCIVIYGCDPATTDPMTIGPVIDARDRGTNLVVIDSRTTVTATKASYALRVRPGTLAVALRGVLRLLFDHQWVDEDFIREATGGAQGLIAELADFPAERVAQLCGVPQNELRRVAEVIGTAAPVQVISGGWLGEEEQGDDDLRLCGALVALRGSIGVPGGGLNLLNASPFDPAAWLDSDEQRAAAGETLSLGGVLGDPQRRLGALFLEGDPCARLPGGAATIQSLANVPLVAVLASYPNATTRWADVVFPMASWLESDGLLANGNGRSLQWHHRVTTPPGECRTPLAFWSDMAVACGFGERFPWFGGASDRRDRAAAEWALRHNPWTRAVTVDLLDPERNPPGGVLWPCTEASEIAFEESRFARGDVRGGNILFQRNRLFPLCDARFPTADGRIALLAGSRAPDVGEEQSEALWMVASLPADHVESYSGFVSDRPGVPGTVTLHLHPRTAAAFGLRDGDGAVIENAHGFLRGVVRVTEVTAANVVWCIAVPGKTVEPGERGATSPWSLFAVPRDGDARTSCALVKIRPDTDRI